MSAIENLKALEEVLESIPEEKYNHSTYRCGTEGCLGGHFCLSDAGATLGLSLEPRAAGFPRPYHALTKLWSYDALAAALGISYEDAEYIFSTKFHPKGFHLGGVGKDTVRGRLHSVMEQYKDRG